MAKITITDFEDMFNVKQDSDDGKSEEYESANESNESFDTLTNEVAETVKKCAEEYNGNDENFPPKEVKKDEKKEGIIEKKNDIIEEVKSISNTTNEIPFFDESPVTENTEQQVIGLFQS